MSQENHEWMFEAWLSGNEAKQGKPWWDCAATHNPEHHFEGPIPLAAIEKLFGFDVEGARVMVVCKDGRIFEAEDYLATVPDNKNAVFGIHSKDYTTDGHQFRQWLIEGPAKCMNGEAIATNAGLLANGAQAWVNISTPEEWKTPQGVDFRPNLLWTTGFDGKIASIVQETDVVSLCDNTVRAALASKGLLYKVKHTKNSGFKLDDAKAALHLLEQNASKFSAEVASLCEWSVSEAQFQRFMSQLVPMPVIVDKDINVRDYSTRTATMAANKRDKLNQLYRADGRVEPWKGTAWGVLQMVNTFNTHIATRREGEHRAMRNMKNVITGKQAQEDNDALAMLAKVCERELVLA